MIYIVLLLVVAVAALAGGVLFLPAEVEAGKRPALV